MILSFYNYYIDFYNSLAYKQLLLPLILAVIVIIISFVFDFRGLLFNFTIFKPLTVKYYKIDKNTKCNKNGINNLTGAKEQKEDVIEILLQNKFLLIEILGLAFLCFYCLDQAIINLSSNSETLFNCIDVIQSDSFNIDFWLYATTILTAWSGLVYIFYIFSSIQKSNNEIHQTIIYLFIFSCLVISFLWVFKINQPYDLKLDLIKKANNIYSENVKNFLVEHTIYTNNLQMAKNSYNFLVNLSSWFLPSIFASFGILTSIEDAIKQMTSKWRKFILIIQIIIPISIVIMISIQSSLNLVEGLYSSSFTYQIALNEVANHHDKWSYFDFDKSWEWKDFIELEDIEKISSLAWFGFQSLAYTFAIVLFGILGIKNMWKIDTKLDREKNEMSNR